MRFFAHAFAALVFATLATPFAAGFSLGLPIPGSRGSTVTVNPNSHLGYVADESAGKVYVLQGATLAGSINVGGAPRWLAQNKPFARVYASGTAGVAVIDAVAGTATLLDTGDAGPIVVNERSNTIYVISRQSPGQILAINGSSNAWTALQAGSSRPYDMALDTIANRLYATYPATSEVLSIDLATGAPTSIRLAGHPSVIAVDERSHQAYVVTDAPNLPVSVIDGFTNTVRNLSMPGHGGLGYAIAVNATTHRVFASFATEIATIDPDGTVQFVATGKAMMPLSIDETANKVYGLAGPRSLLILDGSSPQVQSVMLSFDAFGVAIDSSQRGYVSGAATAQLIGDTGRIASKRDHQGLWWKSPAGSESGWGLNVAQQGDVMFATWFTYDEFGNPLWLVAPDMRWGSGEFNPGSLGAGEEFGGTLYQVTGPPYTGAFDSSRVSPRVVGFLTLRFDNANDATLAAYVNDAHIVRTITPQVFGSPMTTCAANGPRGAQPNYTDLWWSSPPGSESGWGVYLTHQADTIFLTWFTYETDGKPLWFVGSNIARTGNATFSGALYRTTGQPFPAEPWESSRVTVMPVGSASLVFTDESHGTLTYAVPGASGSKAITRQVFATPPTVCR